MKKFHHSIFHQADKGRVYVKIKCPWCGKEFEIEKRKTHLIQKNKKSTSCSKFCSTKLEYLYFNNFSEWQKRVDESVICEYRKIDYINTNR